MDTVAKSESRHRPAVLVVDDEIEVARVFARGLAYAGYETQVVTGGAEALNLLATRAFDALLSDIHMPGMSGVDLQRLARAKDPDLAVLLVTAAQDIDRAVECMREGVYDYLLKPVSMADMGVRLAKALERRHLVRQNRAHQVELERRVAEQADHIRAMYRQLLEAQEKERAHIARELHDEVGQILTALKLSLEVVKRVPPEKAAARLEDAGSMVHELMARVREMSLDLRPSMLDDLGLLPALQWHIRRFSLRTGIHLVLDAPGDHDRYPPEIETAVYRIAQEALTNIARHSGAREAKVTLKADLDRLYVAAEDTGHGFALDSPLRSRTSGVSGMRERAVLLGGKLEITSAPGKGTRVVATFPLTGSGNPGHGAARELDP